MSCRLELRKVESQSARWKQEPMQVFLPPLFALFLLRCHHCCCVFFAAVVVVVVCIRLYVKVDPRISNGIAFCILWKFRQGELPPVSTQIPDNRTFATAFAAVAFL